MLGIGTSAGLISVLIGGVVGIHVGIHVGMLILIDLDLLARAGLLS